MNRRPPSASKLGFILFLAFWAARTGNSWAQVHDSSRPPIIFTQAPRVVARDIEYPKNQHNGELPVAGSRIARISDPSSIAVLTPNFETAARPRVSPDSTHVLFVGRRDSTQRMSVWQMKADGTDTREVADCEGDCVEVQWLSTLYTLDDAAPSRRIAYVCRPKFGPPAIFTSRMDGTDRRQITFGPLGAVAPVALPDGRLFFRSPETSAALESGPREMKIASAFVVHIDGTDLTALTPGALTGSGDLGARFLPDKSEKYQEDQFDRRSLPDGSCIDSRMIDLTKSRGLVVVDPVRGMTGVLYDSPEWDEIEPEAVMPYQEPPGHSSAVRDTAKSELFCLDVSIAEDKTIALGSARRVRVLAAESGAKSVAERSLGEAAIEDDGSFFIEVPSRTAIRVELLGKDGEVVQDMKNWVWVMPGERRGCIGCHEDPQRTPPNRHVLALRKPAQALRSSDDIDMSSNSGIQVQKQTQP